MKKREGETALQLI